MSKAESSRLLSIVALAAGIACAAVAMILISTPRKAVPVDWRYEAAPAPAVPASLMIAKRHQIQPLTEAPAAIAVDEAGCLIEADRRHVVVHAAGQKPQAEYELPLEPICLAATNQTIYAASERKVISIDRLSGKISDWLVMDGESRISGLAADDKRVFVADSGKRQVLHCSLAGNILGAIDGKVYGDRETFVLPSSCLQVALAGSEVMVTNPGRHRVERWTLDLHRQQVWGDAGNELEQFSGCCNPVSMAAFADGRVVVAEKGRTLVKLYDSRGHLLGILAGPDDFKARSAAMASAGLAAGEAAPLQLAATGDDRVYVLDSLTHNLRCYVIASASSKGSADE